tara:strand:- start:1414 stop:1542 length:129 start_codon:yes stop_codon:yes gene_type:complete
MVEWGWVVFGIVFIIFIVFMFIVIKHTKDYEFTSKGKQRRRE